MLPTETRLIYDIDTRQGSTTVPYMFEKIADSISTHFVGPEQRNVPSIILMKTSKGGQGSGSDEQIFGGFASDLWKNDHSKPHSFGSPECFLFNITKDKKIVAKSQPPA